MISNRLGGSVKDFYFGEPLFRSNRLKFHENRHL
uniref:Uncharacterized protein n=1 Tax=Myoviridae sp. cts9u10 TaxID=2825187 RepID=A0A8S5NZ80_9CAUD|nr:MAG TPA: hypothetical protein [Myoviridae sp. cts9u10]